MDLSLRGIFGSIVAAYEPTPEEKERYRHTRALDALVSGYDDPDTCMQLAKEYCLLNGLDPDNVQLAMIEGEYQIYFLDNDNIYAQMAA